PIKLPKSTVFVQRGFACPPNSQCQRERVFSTSKAQVSTPTTPKFFPTAKDQTCPFDAPAKTNFQPTYEGRSRANPLPCHSFRRPACNIPSKIPPQLPSRARLFMR